MSIKQNTIELGDFYIIVTRDTIKNVHLSVYPPDGHVTVSAPLTMDLQTIRLFCLSKLKWIRKQQKKYEEQKRETQREYSNRESHYYLGQRYLLKVIPTWSRSRVTLTPTTIRLHLNANTPNIQKEDILSTWYRSKLKEVCKPLIAKIETKMEVKANTLSVRKMKTKWGTCNHELKQIRLNIELAKKPIESIEYVLIHELVHLKVEHHNSTFIYYMDKYLPDWRHRREALNKSALGHIDWEY